jgi:hypothetical protein
LAHAWLITFWSFCLCTAWAFPKMQAFINMVLMSKTSYRSWRPPRFGLFCHQAMHLLQMLGQQPFGIICENVSANFKLPFWPNLCAFFVLPSQIRSTKGC